MTLDDAVHAWLREVDPGRIAVAVSGGADSTALAAAVCEDLRRRGISPAGTVVLAHFDHGIRSDHERDEDLRIVRELAARYQAPLVTGRTPSGSPVTPMHHDGAAGGLEAVARASRYRFLVNVCHVTGAGALATAHTRDDQVETVTMRLFDGVEGTLLAGIPQRRRLDRLVGLHRPLLAVPGEEIRAWLRRRGLAWAEDSSNADPVHRRNRVRHEILPQIEVLWPAVGHDLSLLAAATERSRRRAGERAAGCTVGVVGRTARIDRAAFFALDEAARLQLLYDTLRTLGLLERRDRPSHRFFAPLLGADAGGERTVIASRGVRASLSGGALVVEPDIVRSGQSGYLRVMAVDRPVEAGLGWSLTLTRDSDTPARGRVLHLNRIRRPVVVRAPRSGDRVTGTDRSLPETLADAGVPRADRGFIPVVVDRDGVAAVLGSVLGYRDVLRPDTRGADECFLIVRSALE
ncbi:MAG: tRNA lysidine(34) synthetase TilS [Spirochaetota bacterium]